MKIFVNSLVTDNEAYLIPCKEIIIQNNIVACIDLDSDELDFDLGVYEFLVIDHDPVE